jgi:hypothetical protein
MTIHSWGFVLSLVFKFRACFVAVVLLWFAALAAAQSVPPSQESVSDQPETQVQLQTLPVESQQWESLAELRSEANTANTTPESDAPDDGTSAAGRNASAAEGLSYDGLATVNNSLTVDGVSAQQSFQSAPRGAVGAKASYSEGAVGSFRVLLHNYSAEFGGAAGGLMQVRSRQGGASRHGSAYLISRASWLAATNPFSIATSYNNGVVSSEPVKPSGSLTQFGGTYGAPLSWRALPKEWQRKITAFASMDVALLDDHIVSTPAEADFYALSASQTALLGNHGVTASEINTALNYLDSLTGTVSRHAYRVQGFGRVDAEVTARDHVALSYSGERSDAPSGAAVGQASDAVVALGTASIGDSFADVEAVTARWAHTFSPRWSNELRAQAAHDLEYETPHSPLPQEPAISPGGYAPQVAISPEGFAYGTPASLGRTAYPDEWRVELADAMKLRWGRHLFTVGGDWSRVHDRIASTTDSDGAFLYESSTVAEPNGLANWITDYTLNVYAYPNAGCSPAQGSSLHYFCFNSFTQGFGPAQTEFNLHEFAGYAEDAFEARKSLTLTLGARYDYTLLPVPQTPNFTLDGDLAALGKPIGGATATFPEDRNNFAVRFGAVWEKRFVTAHLGYGVFFGRTPGATIRAALTDTALAASASTATIRIRPTTETLCPQITSVQQGFGYPCVFTSQPPAAAFQTTSAVLFSSHFRAPMVQRASLDLEHEVGKRTTVRLGYAMAIAVQLPQSVDVNIAPAASQVEYTLQGGDGFRGLHTGETFVVPLYTERRTTNYGPVTALVSNANATYHSGTMEVRWRGPSSVEMRGSYTFSRAIDYGPQSSATPTADGQFDPYRDGYDKGFSSQNFPQRFAGDVQYELRVKSGPKELRRTLNGWRVAAIATAGSGAPYSYQIFGGSYLTGGRESINGSDGETYLPTVGRNTLRLPAQGKVDLRVGREFKPVEKVRLNVFAEAFNLLNEVNVSRVQTRAFLLGNPDARSISGCPASPKTTLVFQDAAALACEGENALPFGSPISSTTGASKERQVEVGLRARF